MEFRDGEWWVDNQRMADVLGMAFRPVVDYMNEIVAAVNAAFEQCGRAMMSEIDWQALQAILDNTSFEVNRELWVKKRMARKKRRKAMRRKRR